MTLAELKTHLIDTLRAHAQNSRPKDFCGVTGLNPATYYQLQDGKVNLSLEAALNAASKLGMKVTIKVE